MKFNAMTKRFLPHKLPLVLLLCGIGQIAFAQFQTTVGFPLPASERSPGGIVLPAGGFALPAANFDHPNSLFGPSNSDWELVFLGPNGTLAGPSKWYGRPSDETAVWMELASCSGQDQFIIAGNDGADMTLALTDLAGDPIWNKRSGTTQHVEAAACVKMDGGGNFALVGTQFDAINSLQNVVVTKVDCQGNLLWDRTYRVSGWLMEAASLTTFSTFIGICSQPNTNYYYITGKMTPQAGGDPRVFLLSVDATSGAPIFLINYDVHPGAEDVGACIQSNCLTTAQPEIWISGYSYDAALPAQTVLLLKTDINGAPIWANNYEVANGDEFSTHFIVNANGKLTLTGKAEETVVFQGTKDGNCMLMQVDGSGNTIDWTRLYINNGFSSQGNRVELVPGGGGYFVSGQALEVISPSQSENNILAVLTDNIGQTDPTCFTNPATTVISRPPMFATFGIPQFTIGLLDFFSNNGVDTLSYTDTQTSCQAVSCVCDFTYTTGNCYLVNFTANCMPPGNYTYEWDLNCDGPDATTTTPNYSYTFPCGGGQYNVCLKVYLNGMLCSSVSHVVTVPSTCCGPILNKAASCTPNNNIYKFVIEVGDSPGASTCQQPVVTINPAVATLLPGLVFTQLANSWVITGFAQVVTSKTTHLVFTVQSFCLCATTGLPMTCTQQVSIALPCCKEILVNDWKICRDLFIFDVPIQTGTWSPLMMISQVSWYVLPQPTGGCPPNHWGGKPYQDNLTGNLEPLHIYPSSLPAGVYCVYAVVRLDDGPCQLLTSNIATLTICEANSCTLNGYDYCYTGTPVLLNQQLQLNINTPPNACPVTSIEWYDPQGNLVQTGGFSFTPFQAISMKNDQLCYEDTFYTVKITDACGMHICQARIRLYSGLAPVGSLVMAPAEPPFLCATNKDATLQFIPECAGDPAMWNWFQQDCIGSPVIPLPDAGTMNGTHNTGQLDESYYFYVEATNGNCPPKQTSLLVEYKSPLSYNNFSASADPCPNQYVDLTLDITPCNIEGCNTPCNCSYTVDWFQNGIFIGSTANVTPPTLATFHYTTLPLHGTYFAVLKADCCPGESITTYPIDFRQCCKPLVMGPCFVCDSVPVTLMAQMVLPPDDPCPDICTFSWFYYDPSTQTETPLGVGATWTTTYGGCYILESDCFGCIKRDTFKLGECYSNPCRRTFVGIEELLAEGQPPLRFYPNPAADVITVEWLGEAPLHARLNIVDLTGRLVRTIDVPDAAATVTISVDDLPSGMFFIQVQEGGRMYRAAKLVVE